MDTKNCSWAYSSCIGHTQILNAVMNRYKFIKKSNSDSPVADDFSFGVHNTEEYFKQAIDDVDSFMEFFDSYVSKT